MAWQWKYFQLTVKNQKKKYNPPPEKVFFYEAS